MSPKSKHSCRLLFAIFMLAFMASMPSITAKTTYIPAYFSQINIADGDTMLVDSSISRVLPLSPNDERFTITVIHDLVTKEKVKAIKRMKASAGWAIVAAGLNGFAAGLNPLRTPADAVTYVNSQHGIVAAGMISAGARLAANSMQQVPISVLIENNSEKEMTVNDMERGLIWFIPAGAHLDLSVGNLEVNKLRIAYNDCTDQHVSYVSIQAANSLSKIAIDYEDDEVWAYKKYGDDQYWRDPIFLGFVICNKETMQEIMVDETQYKKFLRDHKK